MDLKSVKLSGLKVAGESDNLPEGGFLAYASTWTREPDSYGDVVAKGAFLDTINDWKASGDTLPILFGHDMVDPFSNIGGALELSEDDHGLLVKGQLDLANPKAAQVYRMLKGRRINQLSFAYDTLEDGMVDLGDEKSARELRKLKLWEVSIVPIGANQDTEVLAVKAHAEILKAIKGFTPKNLESLASARDSIDALIKAASSTEDTPKASQPDPDAEALARRASESRARSALSGALVTAAF